ncbi:replication factor A protein 3 [Tricholoma matsutake]|nr:replication factor A protein 3 [Tricholoma matsutake 945]
MSSEHVSTRVNSSRLPKFVGKTVRLACKVLRQSGDNMTVQASDDGEVLVQHCSNANITEPYVEIIGKVIDATTIRMLTCTNLGPELDMKLVNDTIELIHDPRFYERMFT